MQRPERLSIWLLCGFLGALLLMLVAGCSEEKPEPVEESDGQVSTYVMPDEPVFKALLPLEAHALMQNDTHLLIVDVRTPAEREQGWIEGSIAATLADVQSGRVHLPENRPLLLVCAVGGRSYALGLYLMQNNYKMVYNLRGGIHGWKKEGLPLVDDHGDNN